MRYRTILCSTAFLAGLGVFTFAAPRTVCAAQITDNTLIASGISVLGLDLSGRTVSEARTDIEAAMEAIAASSLTVTFGDQSASVSLSGLGLTWDTEATVTEAATYGSVGSLITRYKEEMNLKYENVDLPVSYSCDPLAVRRFVDQVISVQDCPAQNASLTREDGEFIVHEGTKGVVTDVSATVDAIETALEAGLSDHMTVEAVTEASEPSVTAEMLSAVQDKLGTYSTDYSSSSYNRQTNVDTAAGRLNGKILMPGESLSVSDTILERTPENGYMLAPQYANGVTEDSYGGGVCQVSTTLYNAVIRAELQVDTRYPHSMVVHYVDYGSDAAISEGNKDFVFTNSTDYPIYIAASADDETLTFSIYGKETRDPGRTIEFVSNTLSEEYPEDQVVYDDTQEEGYESVTGSVSPEVTATLTKIVYENGTEVSRELMHTDTYEGTSRIITKGTKKPEPETTAEETSEEETSAEETSAEESSKESESKESEQASKKSTEKSSKETTAESSKKSSKETTGESSKKSSKETTAESSQKSSKKSSDQESADSGE